MKISFDGHSDDEVIATYGSLLKELKQRGIIRTHSIVGEFGERIAINHYNSTPRLTKLSKVPPGTKGFDAVGRNGKRYSIKATVIQVTGTFFGLPAPTSQEVIEPKFDFVIIVKFDRDYAVQTIAEITWDHFVEFRKWLPRMNAYNLPLTKKLLAKAKILFTGTQSAEDAGSGQVA